MQYCFHTLCVVCNWRLSRSLNLSALRCAEFLKGHCCVGLQRHPGLALQLPPLRAHSSRSQGRCTPAETRAPQPGILLPTAPLLGLSCSGTRRHQIEKMWRVGQKLIIKKPFNTICKQTLWPRPTRNFRLTKKQLVGPTVRCSTPGRSETFRQVVWTSGLRPIRLRRGAWGFVASPRRPEQRGAMGMPGRPGEGIAGAGARCRHGQRHCSTRGTIGR